jgi:hypothetical protein
MPFRGVFQVAPLLLKNNRPFTGNGHIYKHFAAITAYYKCRRFLFNAEGHTISGHGPVSKTQAQQS